MTFGASTWKIGDRHPLAYCVVATATLKLTGYRRDRPPIGYMADGEKEGMPPYMATIPDELSSEEKFFTALGISGGERKFLTKYARYRYRYLKIPKRSGGQRLLLIPDDRLKYIQRKLLAILSSLYKPRVPVHGFLPERSALTNASAHQRRHYLLTIDLLDFFPSVTSARVTGVFRSLGIEAAVSAAIGNICTVENQLPQGAPTSPLISNMICYRLDLQLMNFAKRNFLKYTRYADDISFSSFARPTSLFETLVPNSGRIGVSQVSNELIGIIVANGFNVNSQKIWYSDRKFRKEVTGLIVNEFVNVKRSFVRNIRSSLNKVHTLGLADAQRDFNKRYNSTSNLENVIRGKIEWLAQVRGRSSNTYRTLAAKYNAQFPTHPLHIEPTYQEIADNAVWVIEYCFDEGMDQGTAFFLKDVGLVTADHVLSNLPRGKPADLYRPKFPSKIYSATPTSIRCPIRDVILLDHNVPRSEFSELVANPLTAEVGERVTALGFVSYGAGDQLGYRTGHVVSRPTKSSVKLIEISQILDKGISGCPIVNDRYEVLAVAHKGGLREVKQLGVQISVLLDMVKVGGL